MLLRPLALVILPTRSRSSGLPRRLSEVGIGPEHFPTIATNAMHDRWLHRNPVKITSPEQVLKILEAAA
jgi:maleylacetate reductase